MKDIIKGHLNEWLGKEDELSESRLAICRACPLYVNSTLGWRCNPNLYLNPDTMEVKEQPESGFIPGCNCRLEAKTRVPEAHCPTGQW